jgi:hypothetical protein
MKLSVKLGVILIGLIIFCAEVCRAGDSWVLWEGIAKNIGSDTIWTTESAFPSYELCTNRIKNICTGSTASMDYSSYTCVKFNYLGYAAWYYKCLPDTVAPTK